MGLDVVYGLENSKERDKINQRNSGLNQVLCNIAKEKNKVICFDFSMLLNSKGSRRSVLIGRFMQNIRLCRKYKVKTAIASFADSPLKMRNPIDIIALFTKLGMGEGDVRKSLNTLEEIAEINAKKRKGELIAEGIEKI